MQDFMQSLQMRCPVPATIGLSTAMMPSAASGWPRDFTIWNSEIFSSRGQPFSGTPKTVFLNSAASSGASFWGFSFKPFEQESFPCSVSYTHLRAHETPEHLVCRLLLE